LILSQPIAKEWLSAIPTFYAVTLIPFFPSKYHFKKRCNEKSMERMTEAVPDSLDFQRAPLD
jgi:hypothetical protein